MEQKNAYILKADSNDEYSVIRVSPDGQQMKRHLLSVSKNGVVGRGKVMVMSEGGDFIFLGYDGKMRLISSERNVLYRSEQSEEDDRDNAGDS